MEEEDYAFGSVDITFVLLVVYPPVDDPRKLECEPVA